MNLVPSDPSTGPLSMAAVSAEISDSLRSYETRPTERFGVNALASIGAAKKLVIESPYPPWTSRNLPIRRVSCATP